MRSEYHFGLWDASKEDDEDLIQNHVTIALDQRLKADKQPTGKQIIVGIKGSGKTALRRHVELTDRAAMALNLNADAAVMNIDAAGVSGRSGRLKNALAVQLLTAFSYTLGQEGRGGQARKALSATAKRGKEVLKNVPDAFGALRFPSPGGFAEA